LSFYRRIIALAFIPEFLTLTSTEMEEYADNHTENFYLSARLPLFLVG
jgi:hypothetical protein